MLTIVFLTVIFWSFLVFTVFDIASPGFNISISDDYRAEAGAENSREFRTGFLIPGKKGKDARRKNAVETATKNPRKVLIMAFNVTLAIVLPFIALANFVMRKNILPDVLILRFVHAAAERMRNAMYTLVNMSIPWRDDAQFSSDFNIGPYRAVVYKDCYSYTVFLTKNRKLIKEGFNITSFEEAKMGIVKALVNDWRESRRRARVLAGIARRRKAHR